MVELNEKQDSERIVKSNDEQTYPGNVDVLEVGELNDNHEVSTRWTSDTKRGLKGRHLSMLAVGGTIGTGLFLISGATIATAGPVGAVLAFIISGIFVYFVVATIGEIAAIFPVSGSFAAYGDRFFDPALGFAQGWCYWFLWVLTLPSELSSAGIIISYWAPAIGTWVWALVFLVLLVGINLFGVKWFGEAEFFFSFLKVLVVIIFIFVGIILNAGGIKGSPAKGFEYWKSATPGAPFAAGWPGVLSALVTAFLSYGGTELVGLTAGEAANPRRDVPKAIKGTIGRILLCYVGSIFVISINIKSTDPSLLSSSASKIAVSPFTLVFRDAGIAAAASVMNAAILVAVISAGNTSIYASSRILHALAINRQAPRIFAYTWKHNGVPLAAIALSVTVSFVAFFGSVFGQGVVFTWLYNLIAICNLLIYMSQCLVHIRFRRGWIKQGNDIKDLPYKAGWHPYTSIFALSLGCLIVAGEGYVAATTRPFAWANIIATYVGIPTFFILYLGCKISKKTKMIPYDEMDFSTGRSFPPSDEEINNLRGPRQLDIRPWKDLDLKHKALKAGNKLCSAVF